MLNLVELSGVPSVRRRRLPELGQKQRHRQPQPPHKRMPAERRAMQADGRRRRCYSGCSEVQHAARPQTRRRHQQQRQWRMRSLSSLTPMMMSQRCSLQHLRTARRAVLRSAVLPKSRLHHPPALPLAAFQPPKQEFRPQQSRHVISILSQRLLRSPYSDQVLI